jgi:hypothetical protein
VTPVEWVRLRRSILRDHGVRWLLAWECDYLCKGLVVVYWRAELVRSRCLTPVLNAMGRVVMWRLAPDWVKDATLRGMWFLSKHW